MDTTITSAAISRVEMRAQVATPGIRINSKTPNTRLAITGITTKAVSTTAAISRGPARPLLNSKTVLSSSTMAAPANSVVEIGRISSSATTNLSSIQTNE